jgi:hypothetical protein
MISERENEKDMLDECTVDFQVPTERKSVRWALWGVLQGAEVSCVRNGALLNCMDAIKTLTCRDSCYSGSPQLKKRYHRFVSIHNLRLTLVLLSCRPDVQQPCIKIEVL